MNHCSVVIIHHFATFKISTNPIVVELVTSDNPCYCSFKTHQDIGRSYKPKPKMYT